MRVSILDFTKIAGLLTLILVAFFGCSTEDERPVEITSPSGTVQVSFSIEKRRAVLFNKKKPCFTDY